MARSHAKILASIWTDPDWIALNSGPQRAYLLVLSQPKLSLVGVIDYMPTRWSGFAADTTPADFDAAVDELERARFVLVDRATSEIAVRSFARHDLPPRPNINLLKGVWSAWSAVTSGRLRHEIAHELPDHLWSEKRCPPPKTAIEMRSSTLSTVSLVDNPQVGCVPVDNGASVQVNTVETGRSNGPSEQVVVTTVYRQPSTVDPQPSPPSRSNEPSVENPDLTVDNAWKLVLENIQRHGYGGYRNIDWPERTLAAVRAVGWRALCTADDRQLPTVRTNFRNAYLAAHMGASA
jgi:hypothetical protein